MKIANFHIRSSNPAAVETVLKSVLKDGAVVTDEAKGWISFYPAEADKIDPGEAYRIAETVSAGLGAPVWSFLVDEKAFAYLVFENGSLSDEYCLPPEHFGSVSAARRARLAGNWEVLQKFAQGTKTDDIKRFLSGASPMGPDTNAFKEKVRKSIQDTPPEAVGQMLGLAAQHMGQMSPEMLKGVLKNAGVPADNPMLAPFLKDPAAFLQQLAGNPMALKMMTQQVSAMSEAALNQNSPGAMPTEMRLLEMAQMLGIEPLRLTLGHGAFERKEVPEAPWFHRL